MEEKTSSQMQNYHQLAKEKATFVTWLEQFKMDCVTHQTWRSVLRQKRDSLLSDLKQVFPIGDLDGKRPTLRWILLPPTGLAIFSMKIDRYFHVKKLFVDICLFTFFSR